MITIIVVVLLIVISLPSFLNAPTHWLFPVSMQLWKCEGVTVEFLWGFSIIHEVSAENDIVWDLFDLISLWMYWV